MIFNLRNSTGKRSGAITEDSFAYTGAYLFARDEQTGHWELALTSSGSLTWLTLPSEVDLCVVGAGQTGGSSFFSGADTKWWNDSFINSGAGGDGGRIFNAPGVQVGSSCAVVIGSSGSDSTLTSDGNVYSSANGPAGKPGGRGAEMRQASNSVGNVNKGGADGVWPYGTATDEQMIQQLQGHRVGASGGGGHANNNNDVYTSNHGGIDTGGATDGGKGAGGGDQKNGVPAAGYGNGGGGAYGDGKVDITYAGGAGSDGIIFIRDHREVS